MHGNSAIVKADSCGQARPSAKFAALTLPSERILVHVWYMEVLTWPWTFLPLNTLCVQSPKLFRINLMLYDLVLTDLNRELFFHFLLSFNNKSLHFMTLFTLGSDIFHKFKPI